MRRRVLVATVAVVTLCGCEREQRDIGGSPLRATLPESLGVDPYSGNAYGTSEGKRLFTWMNCSGCHANGGGGIGPALMDSLWRYGNRPADIYQTIVAGRPNGMPAFGNRLNAQQTWQLVAYVQSLSAVTPKWVRPGRDDHMLVKKSEQQTQPVSRVLADTLKP
jgi:cytochrome c oxidase cbb3-type subunit III